MKLETPNSKFQMKGCWRFSIAQVKCGKKIKKLKN
jgi:hypothetical protein